MPTKIQLRRGTAAEWSSANPLLAVGEMGLEIDTLQAKIGNGIEYWNSLPYAIVTEATIEGMIASHADRTDNPHSVTKTQIGLSSVDNVSASALRDRSTHTGTQLASTVSDFDASTDARIDLQKGDALGLATLDSGGKVPASQLPSTIMEFQGTWNASTNTPTLANGSGSNQPEDAGHVYVCSVGGTVDFGAGDIVFAAGDWVVLSASLTWEKSVNSNAVVSVNGHQGVVVLNKSDVGLSNVDNTSDANKPISTATQTALDLKYDASNPSSYVNASGAASAAPVQSVAGRTGAVVLTKSDVGLSSVDNVSAASLRDRSTHTGTQLASTISNFTAAVQGTTLDAAQIDGGGVSNTEFAYLANVTSDIQTQLNGKEATVVTGTTSQYYRGDKTFQTLDKTAVGLSNVDNVSAADLRDRSTHTGNETVLTWSEGQSPSAPGSGLTSYAKSVGGRNMLGQIGKSGVDYSFQPFLARNRSLLFQANGNATTTTIFGSLAPTASGTATSRTVATTNLFTWTRRIGYVTTTTNNSTAGVRSAALQNGLSNIAGAGGFHFVTRFGISDASLVAGARLFVGMVGTTALLGNNDPSTNTNIIGVGLDAADTTLQIMYNGTGTATKINLGANFPESANTDLYELSLYAAPNSTTVSYGVVNLSTGAIASGTITTNLPAVNTLLTYQLSRHNATTGAAVGLDIVSIYLETDN